MELDFSVDRRLIFNENTNTPTLRNCFFTKQLEENCGEGGGGVPLRGVLFQRVLELTGVRVSEQAKKRFRETGGTGEQADLDLLDVVEVGERVKHMDVVWRTKGTFFQLKAVQEGEGEVACSLLERSIGLDL